MNKFLVLGALALGLAACGGGGGGVNPPGPTPTPHVTPTPTAFSFRINFKGGDELSTTTQSLARRNGVIVLHPFDTSMSTSVQAPLVMSVPNPSNSFFAEDDVQSQGIASVAVSPQPSSSPTATFSVGDPQVTVTPVPSPSVPEVVLQSQQGATAAASTVTANVTLSGTQTPVSANLYLVSPAHMACGDTQLFNNQSQVNSADQSGGIQFVNGVAQAASSTSSADVYLDGSWCTAIGFQNNNDANVTLYAPFGALQLSSTINPFSSITASMWTNSFNSISVASLATDAADPTTPMDELLIKTADGHIVKIALNELNAGTPPSGGVHGTPATLNMSFEESGFSVDGF